MKCRVLSHKFAGILALSCSLAAGSAYAASDSFASLMDAAMSRMDRAMMQPASGDVDRDFAAMMIPHHQGAVDMAQAELRYGHDPVLLRLAQGILVEQRQEIEVMQRALVDLPASAAPQTMPHPHMQMEQHK